MAKGINESIEQTSAKYNISATFHVEGVVEVQDVVGALFGQTEGLLNDLELRELQKSGRIGRIVVDAKSEMGKTKGTIIIPSSLDRTETAILAATLETVDRVGPCSARLQLIEIRDLRASKLEQIERRAKQLLKNWKKENDEKQKISEKINTELERESIITYKGLPAGSEINTAKRIIIVEGRNDIQQLLKIGIKYTIAVNGTSVPKTIIDLTHQRECTAFLDGDRGGDMILNELLQVSKIKYYARAPASREVEELSASELVNCLQKKRPIEDLYKEKNKKAKQRRTKPRSTRQKTNYKSKKHRKSSEKSHRSHKKRGRPSRTPNFSFDKKIITPFIKKLVSSNEVVFLDKNFKELKRSRNINVIKEIEKNTDSSSTILIDGVVNQSLLDKALEKKINRIIAVNINPDLEIKNPRELELFYFKDFL